jgi:hypothetical protein
MEADKDGDGKISFDEFCQMVASTVRYLSCTSLIVGCRCEHDFGGCITCRFGRVERVVRIPQSEGMYTTIYSTVVTGGIMLDVNLLIWTIASLDWILCKRSPYNLLDLLEK